MYLERMLRDIQSDSADRFHGSVSPRSTGSVSLVQNRRGASTPSYSWFLTEGYALSGLLGGRFSVLLKPHRTSLEDGALPSNAARS